MFGSVGDDHNLLIWDLRSPVSTKPVQSVAAHQGEVSILLSLKSPFLCDVCWHYKRNVIMSWLAICVVCLFVLAR